MNKAYQYYKDLPSWAKGVVVVGVLGATILVGAKIYKKIFPSQSEKKSREEDKNVDRDIKESLNKGLKPSFSTSSYDSYANTIYQGMRYCVGDDYGTVADTLKKMKNDLDVALLIKSFGKRQNYCFGVDSGDPMGLFAFVQKELGNEWGGITNYRVVAVNKDWKSKGITYQI